MKRRRLNPPEIRKAAEELLELVPRLKVAARKDPDGAGLVARVAQLARLIQIRALTLEAARPNPPLLIFGNPPAGAKRFGRRVYSVKYRHAEDGENYVHEFGSSAQLWALSDGRILISSSDGRPLWKEF